MHKSHILTDIASLGRALEERFAYLHANGVDHKALLADLRRRSAAGWSRERFGLELQKLLAHFIDGHVAIDARPHPEGYTPFLAEVAAGRFVALSPDRSSFLHPGYPYLSAIDGIELETWLTAAAAFIPSGSPQYVTQGNLRYLRAVQMLRMELGLPHRDTLGVTLRADDGASTVELSLPVAEQAPRYPGPPSNDARVLEGNVGYFRLGRMSKETAGQVRRVMSEFEDTDAIVLDVRGNSGGTRDALLELFPYFMAPDDKPRIANVAAYRLHDGFGDDHLSARRMYLADADHWTAPEKEAIRQFQETFRPEWQPPAGEFSDWHYCVLSRREHREDFTYDRPVVVLSDPGSFSATDVFLAAFKGWRSVTLMGQPSAGGSARAMTIALSHSGFKVRLASMASFQPSGHLFDGRGVHPDIPVHPAPNDFLPDGPDTVLATALDYLSGQRS